MTTELPDTHVSVPVGMGTTGWPAPAKGSRRPPSAQSTVDAPAPPDGAGLDGRYDHHRHMAELSVANLDVRALASQTHTDGPSPTRRPHPALYGLMAAFVGATVVATLFLAMGTHRVSPQLDTKAPSASVDPCDRSHPNCAP